MSKKLQCEMDNECSEPVSHIDYKGYIYCKYCVQLRSNAGIKNRKLKLVEIEKLQEGQTIKW